MHWITEEDNLF